MGHPSRTFLFHLEPDKTTTLQAQLRRMLVSAILDGQIPPGSPLPSCRSLAQSLKIARNTVVLAYQDLVEEGFLISRQRSGFFANPDILGGRVRPNEAASGQARAAPSPPAPDWQQRFRLHPSQQRNIVKPANWQDYPYPFIYGQVDQGLFPLAAWRECSRQALSVTAVKDWSKDRFADDDPALVEQLRTRVLPRRGVRVGADEILVTVGAQNALYLLAGLLFDRDTTFGIENPGYTDARNIASLHAGRVLGIGVDEQGMVLSSELDSCDYVYVTPSHQFPTTVTMSLERRHALLERAAAFGLHRHRRRLRKRARPPGQPAAGAEIPRPQRPRHLHLVACRRPWRRACAWASWSGPAPLIEEARALAPPDDPPPRRQQPAHHRHVPGRRPPRRAAAPPVQRLSRAVGGGDHRALVKHLPEFSVNLTAGGTALWIRGPKTLDMSLVGNAALKRGVVIEPGAVPFHGSARPGEFLPPGRFIDSDREDRSRHQAARRSGARTDPPAALEWRRRGRQPPVKPRCSCRQARPPSPSRRPNRSPIQRFSTMAYGHSFADFDECSDAEAGRIWRRAILERFEQCPFSPEARAKFQASRIEFLERTVSEFLPALEQGKRP